MGLCICLLFGVGLIGAVIMSLVVDATHKFEEAAKIGFGLWSCSLIAIVTVRILLFTCKCTVLYNVHILLVAEHKIYVLMLCVCFSAYNEH